MQRARSGSLLAAALLVAAASALVDASPGPILRAEPTPAPPGAEPQVIQIVTSLDTQTLAHELIDAYTATEAWVTSEIAVQAPAQVADAVLGSQASLGLLLVPVSSDQGFAPLAAWIDAEAHLIGWEAIVLVTHPLRQTQGWDRNTLAGVLGGEIQDWQELQSGQGAISLLGRAEGAASREALLGYLGLITLSSRVELLPSDAEICRQVASRPLALGWIGHSATTDQCQPLPLDGVEPSTQAVQSGEYGARLALVLLVAPHAPPEARALAVWAASAQGQRIVAQRYVPAS